MSQTTEAVDHEHGETLQSLRDRCKHLENMLNFMQRLLDERNATITDLQSQLEAVGAGGVSKLIPSVQADSVILSRDLTAAIISIINDSKTPHGDQLAREFWAIERLVEALEKAKSRQVKSQQQSNLSTDYQVEQLAHRACLNYHHSPDSFLGNTYTFNRHTLLDFARTLREGGAA